MFLPLDKTSGWRQSSTQNIKRNIDVPHYSNRGFCVSCNEIDERNKDCQCWRCENNSPLR